MKIVVYYEVTKTFTEISKKAFKDFTGTNFFYKSSKNVYETKN